MSLKLTTLGCELDALFMKPDAIIVLEFKNYGGKIKAVENGDWLNDDEIIVKGGYRKNPYSQVKQNKWALIEFLKENFSRDCINVHHVSGFVVFNKDIELEDYISDRVKSWFTITDMSNVINAINDRTSSSINCKDSDILKFPEQLLLTNKQLAYSSEGVENVNKVLPQKDIIRGTIQFNNFEAVLKTIEDSGFTLHTHFQKEKIEGKTKDDISELRLSELSQNYIGNKKLWEHQYEAIKKAKESSNICIATPTSSGKSLVFQISALEILAKTPTAKILAIYPMKALGNQQEQKWRAINENIKVGRIDGSIKGTNTRNEILNNSQIIIMTPDVVHTYLLGRMSDNDAIKNFLRNLQLIIIDEIHTFIGVFGSNSAYMMRRLNSCVQLLGGKVPQYITASATIASPETHSENITGVKYEIIGSELDSSPKSAGDILFLNSKNQGNVHLDAANLLRSLRNNVENSRIIAFVDSRTKASHVAIAANDDPQLGSYDKLEEAGIYSYKSGLEDEIRQRIENALENGTIRGVISTSALEIGIDIPGLNIVILIGVPNSSTSLKQRIGRVGRGSGDNQHLIIVINDGSLQSKILFDNPSRFHNLPMIEPALYLENKRLQAIQALHFIGNNGEYQECGGNEKEFIPIQEFPAGFHQLCTDILVTHQYPEGYDDIQEHGGDYSQLAYPLRSFDPQYQLYEVTRNRMGRYNRIDNNPLSYLTYDQVFREAYPNAIYHSGNRYYRVPNEQAINRRDRTIEVVEEHFGGVNVKLRRTQPYPKAVALYPQIRNRNRYDTKICGEAKIFNLDVIENTSIRGWKEEIVYNNGYVHPANEDSYRRPFSRDLHTTGVTVFHPILNVTNVQRSYISQLLYESFLLDNAFERSDINHKNGRVTVTFDGVNAGDHFIAIYDLARDGLNITSKLMDEDVLKKAFKRVKEIVDNNEYTGIIDADVLQDETKEAINVLYDCFNENEIQQKETRFGNDELVIMPDSFGEYYNEEDNERIRVEILEVAPYNGSLHYTVRPNIHGSRKVPVGSVLFTAESRRANFNYYTGDCEELTN